MRRLGRVGQIASLASERDGSLDALESEALNPNLPIRAFRVVSVVDWAQPECEKRRIDDGDEKGNREGAGHGPVVHINLRLH